MRSQILKVKNKGAHEKIYRKVRTKLKNKDIHIIPKMLTNNKPLPPEGMAQSTLREYYEVVQKPPEQKNQEKALKSEEEIKLFVGTSDSKDNADIITTHNTRTEKVTNKETNTAPMNFMHQDKDKDEEEAKSIDEESEEKLLDGLDSQNKNNDKQKSYFNTESGEATDMGANTASPSVESIKSSGLLGHVLKYRSNIVEKSNKDCTEENMGNEMEKAEDSKDNDSNLEENIMKKSLEGTDTEKSISAYGKLGRQ